MTYPASLTPRQAAQCLVEGDVIAYPTEAVYGLGCDPDNEAAVRRILRLKSRPASAGLILIADCLERFAPYIEPVAAELRDRALDAWPGPVTWLFPRAAGVPDWLAGTHSTIALRLTAHAGCRALCEAFGKPVVSTSANPRNEEPARSAEEVANYFPDQLCGIMAGELGTGDQPSEIRDLASGRVIRAG
jgi:L-threonylcarbamoyladenylate synthase